MQRGDSRRLAVRPFVQLRHSREEEIDASIDDGEVEREELEDRLVGEKGERPQHPVDDDFARSLSPSAGLGFVARLHAVGVVWQAHRLLQRGGLLSQEDRAVGFSQPDEAEKLDEARELCKRMVSDVPEKV